jgi:hypothetical protein
MEDLMSSPSEYTIPHDPQEEARGVLAVADDGIHVKAVSVLTAEPIMRLLLAAEGLEPPSAIAFPQAWRAFQRFCAIPAIDRDDGASFQCDILTEGEAVAEIRLVRQLSGVSSDSDWTQSVVVQFLHSRPPAYVEPCEIWSSDCPDFRNFVETVESLPAFDHAWYHYPDNALLCVVDPDEE